MRTHAHAEQGNGSGLVLDGPKSRMNDATFNYLTDCLIHYGWLFNMQTHHLELLVVLGRDVRLGGVARVLQVPSGFVYATIMTCSERHKTTPPHQIT